MERLKRDGLPPISRPLHTGEIEILTVAGKPNEVEVVWHSARDGLTFDDVLFRAQ